MKRPKSDRAIELAEILAILDQHPRAISCEIDGVRITMRDDVPMATGTDDAADSPLDLPPDAPDPRALIRAQYEQKMGKQTRTGKVPR